MDVIEIVVLTLVVALMSGVLSGWYFSRRMHQKVTYMLDALEDGESNFRFGDKRFFNRFHRTLNRLRGIFDKERRLIQEQEHYYARMLEQVTTGILVSDCSPKRSGRVLYCNAAALNMLGFANISHIRQLAEVDKNLESELNAMPDGGEKRVNFYNERGKMTVAVTAITTLLRGQEVKIFALNDITGEMAHNEEQSWNRLIRVLTHEIMNTVTPIASLSHMLSQEINGLKTPDSLDLEELRVGLGAIEGSSKGIIRFVETYRSLTHVSAPVKRAFYVEELITKVRQLVTPQLDEAAASLTYCEKSDDILLYADENQLSQVLVNLVKNALQAGASKIEISAEIDASENVVVAVSNNGRAISEESRDEIFVPFYTTKQEGTGIGLSLCRQIMRMHNGSLTLTRSDEKMTTFVLYFK